MVKPTNTLQISKDETDNPFYECAEAAGADYLVTGNIKHFPKDHKTTKVVSPRQMVEVLTTKKK